MVSPQIFEAGDGKILCWGRLPLCSQIPRTGNGKVRPSTADRTYKYVCSNLRGQALKMSDY